MMMKEILLLALLFSAIPVDAQEKPTRIDRQQQRSKIKMPVVVKAASKDIGISLFKSLSHLPVRIVYDSGNQVLYTCNIEGQIFRTPIIDGKAGDETLFIAAEEHKINYLQGMVFFDNTFILVGNNNNASLANGYGVVEKCGIMPDGTHQWTTMLTTEVYPSSGTLYDHAFAGVCLSPSKDSLYISSGSRTDHGEVKNSGSYTGLRELPLTAKIFRIPVDAVNIYLPNDEQALTASGYVFAQGIRNEFDMAFTADGKLFGLENSGDRDDPEELNWLRANHHYGFPWRMGGNDTPMQFVPYIPEQDKLIPANALTRNIFYNDPGYPTRPKDILFTEPVKNIGPDANWVRDPSSGRMHQKKGITTFTGHRSPVGLVFDADSSLNLPYKGSGFMLAYSPEEPAGGYGPVQDRGGDLCQLQLTYDPANDNYSVRTSRLITGFFKLTDAEKAGNAIFITDLTGKIWKVSFRR